MKKRTVKYTDDQGEIMGELRAVIDELPSLEDLAGETGGTDEGDAGVG